MKVNDIVENFTLQNQDGKNVSLTDFKGKPVVLFSILAPIRQAAPLNPVVFVTHSKSFRRPASSYSASLAIP